MTTTTANGDAVLAAKLSEVMASVDRIPKNGWNDHFRYKFATESDVSDAIRNELANRKVCVLVDSNITEIRPITKDNGKSTFLTDTAIRIRFICGDTGAVFTVEGCGTGDDASDKGTYKSITGAIKYALMKTFLVPTGDDPEATAPASGFSKSAASSPSPVQKRSGGASPVTHEGVDNSPATPQHTTPSDVFVWKGGKNDGKPITDIDDGFLSWAADRCDVNDPKWGKSNAVKLAAIQAEQARRAEAGA